MSATKRITPQQICREFDRAGLSLPHHRELEAFLDEILEDPSGFWTPAGCIRIGKAMQEAGSIIEAPGRRPAENGGPGYEDNGVKAKWQEPSWKPDDKAVFETFPPETHAHLYVQTLNADAFKSIHPRSKFPDLYIPGRAGYVRVNMDWNGPG